MCNAEILGAFRFLLAIISECIKIPGSLVCSSTALYTSQCVLVISINSWDTTALCVFSFEATVHVIRGTICWIFVNVFISFQFDLF